jgi:hypothetical protein
MEGRSLTISKKKYPVKTGRRSSEENPFFTEIRKGPSGDEPEDPRFHPGARFGQKNYSPSLGDFLSCYPNKKSIRGRAITFGRDKNRNISAISTRQS